MKRKIKKFTWNQAQVLYQEYQLQPPHDPPYCSAAIHLHTYKDRDASSIS